MLKENERSKFLYDTKKLLPYQKKRNGIKLYNESKRFI